MLCGVGAVVEGVVVGCDVVVLVWGKGEALLALLLLCRLSEVVVEGAEGWGAVAGGDDCCRGGCAC